MLAGLRGDRAVRDVCREYEIAETLYYQWRERLLEGGKAALANPREKTAEHTEIAELQAQGRAAGAGAGPQDLRAGGRGGTLAGLDVSVRVARSRAVVAAGYRPAVVARVAGVSRQALYRPLTPATSGGWSGRAAGPATRRSWRWRRRTRPTAPGWSPRWPAAAAGRAGEPQAGAAGHARPPAAAALPQRRPPPAAGVLPGHPPGRALAHRHDEGVDRAARLGLPARHRRLLHPRDRRLVAWICAAATTRRSPSSRPPSWPAGSSPAGSRSAPTTARSSPAGTSASTCRPAAITHRRGGYRDPESQAFIESWFGQFKKRCAWRSEWESHRAGEKGDRRTTSTATTTGRTPASATAPRPRSPTPGKIPRHYTPQRPDPSTPRL